MHRTLAAWLVIACALAACSRTFDWRETHTPEAAEPFFSGLKLE